MVQPVGCAVTQTFVLLPELGYVTINPLQQVGVGVGVAVRATVEIVEVMVVKIIVPLLAAGFKHASALACFVMQKILVVLLVKLILGLLLL